MSKFLRTQKQLGGKIDTKLLSERRRDKERLPWKRVLIIFGILLAFAGVIYLLVYSPAFRVDKISVKGVEKAEMLQIAQIESSRALRGYTRFVWPRDNILFLSVDNLHQILSDKLVFDSLSIKKDLPNNLEIKIEEKIPVLLWQEGQDYFYVDKVGQVMKSLSLSEVEYDLPTVSYSTTTEVIVGKKVIEVSAIDFIKRILQDFQSHSEDWRIVRVVVPEISNQDFRFYTNEGWYIILPNAENIEARFEILYAVLDQKIENRAKLEYIDLRILDRIFYY